MAFRSEEASSCLALCVVLLALVALVVFPAPAQQDFVVRHQRSLWKDKPGRLRIDGAGLQFTAAVKKGDAKPMTLSWNDIQQCILAPGELRIVTYQDQRWQFGRDRHFRFTLAAEAGAAEDFTVTEEALAAALGQRLVRALPGAPSAAAWSLPAKRTGVPRGAEGVLYFDGQELRFDSNRPGQSRRWELAHIATIASNGPLHFMVVAPERALADQGGHRSFDFQLKQPLTPERYRQVWLAIEAAHGTQLRFHQSN